MSALESLPLLVVVVLLLSATGADPSAMTVVFDGETDLAVVDNEVVAVGGGTATLEPNATAAATVFVIGGDVTVRGTLEGDARVFAGNLTVAPGASIRGELQTIGGETTVAPGGTVERRTSLAVAPRPRSPVERAGFILAQVLVMAGLAALVARRVPGLLATVGETVTGHALVSGVVGSLTVLTLLVLFVYMAFTLVLVPVSVLGLLGMAGVGVYTYLVYGFLIGQRLPVTRPDVAAAAGVGAYVLLLEGLGFVPLLGTVVQLGLLAVGFGAVLLSYFGLQTWEPVSLPR